MRSIEVFRIAEIVTSFAKDDVVYSAGDDGDTMYAVIEGYVDLIVEDVPVERVGLGEFFGELALIDQAPRASTAVAATDCRLAIINRKQFELMVANTPFFAVTVMERMAMRLRRANHHR